MVQANSNAKRAYADKRSREGLSDKEKISRLAHALLWRCGDCGNVYTRDVFSCNNHTLDQMILDGIITKTHIQEAL